MTGGELRRKRIAYDEKVDVVLTEKDRSLILEETFVETSTVRLLNLAIARGSNLVVRMTMGDLDDLLGYVAAAANHAKTRRLQDQLEDIYLRLKGIEDQYEEDDL
jgi:hypothetical protein